MPDDDILTRQLRDALARHASETPVDLERQWAALEVRLRATAPRRALAASSPRRLRPTVAVLATCMAVVVVAVGASVVAAPWSRAPLGPAVVAAGTGSSAPVRGPVVGWACPDRITTSEQSASLENPPGMWLTGFGTLDDLDGVPPEAVAFDVPRFEIVTEGDGAELRYGTADGAMTSRSVLRHAADGWAVVEREVCSGPDRTPLAPVTRPRRLGAHAPAGPPPPGAAVLIDARPFYDQTGQTRVSTVYVGAGECPPGLGACLDEHTSIDTDAPAGSAGTAGVFADQGVGCQPLVWPGYAPWGTTERTLQLCATYVLDTNRVAEVAVADEAAGSDPVTLRAFRAAGWSGTYYAAVLDGQPRHVVYTGEDGSIARRAWHEPAPAFAGTR